MNEGLCGKSCGDCPHFQNGCPGCAQGPGQKGTGECELARCRREHGYPACSACRFRVSCGTYRRWHDAQAEKLDSRREEIDRRLARSRSGPEIAPWLWALFVLSILLLFDVNIQSGETVGNGFTVSLNVVETICSAAYGVVLLRLSREEEAYGMAGVLSLVSSAVSLLSILLVRSPVLLILAAFAAAVLSLVSARYEYQAHAALAERFDPRLGESWRTLWKAVLVVLILGIADIAAVFVPALGMALLIIAAVGGIVTGIAKLVLLWRTARLF